MKQCCLALCLRGPQHLMETIGHLLPRGWSIVELTSNDEVIEIQADHLDSILEGNRANNYVLCSYSRNLQFDADEITQIPSSASLRDIIIFSDTHWKSALCNSHLCCPHEGKEYFPSLTTCVAIDQWQEALADWVLDSTVPNLDLLQSLLDLDVRDWLLSRAVTSTRDEWREFLEMLAEKYSTVALHTILAGFHLASEDTLGFASSLSKAVECDEKYPLLQLLQRGLESSMPSKVLVESLQRFESSKNNIQCIKKVSLPPKASPPTATRTGER